MTQELVQKDNDNKQQETFWLASVAGHDGYHPASKTTTVAVRLFNDDSVIDWFMSRPEVSGDGSRFIATTLLDFWEINKAKYDAFNGCKR